MLQVMEERPYSRYFIDSYYNIVSINLTSPLLPAIFTQRFRTCSSVYILLYIHQYFINVPITIFTKNIHHCDYNDFILSNLNIYILRNTLLFCNIYFSYITYTNIRINQIRNIYSYDGNVMQSNCIYYI